MEFTGFGGTFHLDDELVDVSGAELERQLRAYERGDRRVFDLAVRYPDDFTGRVMRAMAAIPRGETRRYGTLAAELGTAPRAVGGACGRNPLPLVVPCHRVVGADSLGGYSVETADPLAVKRRVLAHEGVRMVREDQPGLE